jgi:hypothetical protein
LLLLPQPPPLSQSTLPLRWCHLLHPPPFLLLLLPPLKAERWTARLLPLLPPAMCQSLLWEAAKERTTRYTTPPQWVRRQRLQPLRRLLLPTSACLPLLQLQLRHFYSPHLLPLPPPHLPQSLPHPPPSLLRQASSAHPPPVSGRTRPLQRPHRRLPARVVTRRPPAESLGTV